MGIQNPYTLKKLVQEIEKNAGYIDRQLNKKILSFRPEYLPFLIFILSEESERENIEKEIRAVIKNNFKEYENFEDVNVTFAHCKDFTTCIKYFAKYKNVFGDSAFCPEEGIGAIKEAGFENRLYFGTDFPITHYFNHREENAIEYVALDVLIEQYKNDIRVK